MDDKENPLRDNLDELRHIEGFPLGDDEDLHALSDPPHYTAYPNPHIAEFIQKYGKPYDKATDDYHREPYVADVSEGKSDPIYNAHSYHTKVPYKAIIPFVEHYTQPGDIIFDGFGGTGMTGIAATISGRRAIISDLSPAASFISYNYNSPIDVVDFEKEAKRIIRSLEDECSWMYLTKHNNNQSGQINYVVWSDVFICPYCSNELVYWDVSIDTQKGKVLSSFPCTNCSAEITRRDLSRASAIVFDHTIGKEIVIGKQVPVLINYSVGNKRFEKKPDKNDLDLIERICKSKIPYWFPTTLLEKGEKTGEPIRVGITHVHQFFTNRNLWVLASAFDKFSKLNNKRIKNFGFFFLTAAMRYLSKMSKLGTAYYFNGGGGAVNAGISGTLFIPSFSAENSVIRTLRIRLPKLVKAFKGHNRSSNVFVSIGSTTDLQIIPENTVDYIFTDPPFGDNLMYSELNFFWESWLKVCTNTGQEAIISKSQKKELGDYRSLMTSCFSEMHKVLKPGRWITVVFHNSKAAVWNAIQESLTHAGFVVAQVTVLDKKQGSYNQVNASGAVKNDLVINAYKPRITLTERFITMAGHGLEVDFVREHLTQLPLSANVERSREMLYSKYLAYYVQHGFQIVYNGEQFYRALPQWGFVERDGYWFADEAQANEYEKRKVKNGLKGQKSIPQGQQVLFISDEKSACQWLWGFLSQPKSYDEIYTAFVKALQTPQDQIPELKVMLEEGFVRANGDWKRPDALTQAELEQRRQQRLLNQFEEYLKAARSGQRLKEVRKEALVAGFTEAYRENRFADILAVGRKLPRRLLEESPDLFDFVDIAEAKMEK